MAKNKMVRGKFTGRAQKRTARKTCVAEASYRNAGFCVEDGTNTKKALLDFSRKIAGRRAEPSSLAAASETPLFTKKRRNSLKNSRKGFFKWPGGPSDKERTFSGQQSSELLAMEAVYLIDTPPAMEWPGWDLSGKNLARCGGRFLFFSSPRRARKGLSISPTAVGDQGLCPLESHNFSRKIE